MSLFGDFQFFLALILLAIPAIVLGVLEKPLKHYTLVVSLVFIWMALGANTKALTYLIVFVIIELCAVKLYLYLNAKYRRNKTLYWIFVIIGILPLVISKVSGLYHLGIFGFLGISYLTFKVVQIIIEIYDEIIKEIDILEFLCFILLFTAITSGPIDRSRRFHQDYTAIIPRDEYLELVGTGLFKICLGMVYKFALAASFFQLLTWFGHGGIKGNLIYMYSYSFYLFFDFAGYSLMAIGASYIFGIKTPENFDKPFLSKDIKDFWNRWHISLSHWFRDFIFSRLMMKFIRGKYFKSKVTAASIGFMINMTIMGIWHGLEIHYIMYGMYHGVLLALTEVYQKKSKFYKAHKKDKWHIYLSWFITFNLIVFGFFIFSGKFTKILGI
ncbi:MAG: D-alanyl-lipoteichoic acid biosynthesis protein DltB [Anaerovoracaceae bacterium]